MTKLCEATRVYLGSVGPLARIYAGDHHLVWPCFDCTIIDPEFALPFYSDAIMYIPKVCPALSIGGGYHMTEAVFGSEVVQGDAFTGTFTIFPTTGAIYGFMPTTDPDFYGEILVESAVASVEGIVGVEDSTVSFYIEISDEISVDDEGLFIKTAAMEIHLIASVFGGTQIKVFVGVGIDIYELQTTTDLTLDVETKIIVTYEKDTRISIYYNDGLAGEVML